jgi:hypothetical protein
LSANNLAFLPDKCSLNCKFRVLVQYDHVSLSKRLLN